MTETVARHDGLLRREGIAAWRRIADQVGAEIAEGRWALGAKLPTEAELAGRFGVNRHTVRRALASLAEEGLVRAARGSGTFVERARIPYPIGARTRFTEIMSAQGHVAGGELIDWDQAQADAGLARKLELPVGAAVLRVRMLRSSDGVPVALGTHFLPLPRFAGFIEAFSRGGAITPALGACGVSDYRRRETRIAAREASGAEAVQLGLDARRTLLVVDALNVDAAGTPIQATLALFAAERIELVVA